MPDRRTVLTLPLLAVAGTALAGPAAAATTPLQSPVDVVPAAVVRRRGLPQLRVDYSRSTPVSVRYVSKDQATGGCDLRGAEETEEVDVEPGAGSVVLSGTRYELLQLHFHTPSEHTVDGRHAPLEMHLVHRAADGRRLVIGVLLLRGPASEADRILARLPQECGEPVEVDDLDLAALLPRNRSTLRYTGSLTTAPFDEGIQWFLTVPMTVSAQGVRAFQTLFPDGDSRPTQPLHGRRLLADVRWRV